MFSRILYSTIAAAALLGAAPAIAGETTNTADTQHPGRCECARMHEHAQRRDERSGAAAKPRDTKRTAPATSSAGTEDAFSGTPSYWTAP